MDFFRLLVRMSLWVRRPPSREWLTAAIVVLIVAIVLVAIERTVGWPDALTVERMPRTVMP